MSDKNFKGHKFFDGITDLEKYLNTAVTDIEGDDAYVPYLQSDYALVIFKDSNINASDYEPVLIQTLDLSVLRNGFSTSMDTWGLQSVNFNASNALTFSYLGVAYNVTNDKDALYNATYTSIIHYYYAKRFVSNGTLKIKLKSDKLPSVMIINTKSNNIVYALYNCVFSYPTFEASPQNNNIAFYKTTVTYSSYKEYLGDNIRQLSISNSGKLGNVDRKDGGMDDDWVQDQTSSGKYLEEFKKIAELTNQTPK